MFNFQDKASPSALSLDFDFMDVTSTDSNLSDFTFKEQKYEDYTENTNIYSLHMNICGRRQMQDRSKIYSSSDNGHKYHFFAIYDGHGSEKVADLLATKLHLEILSNPSFLQNPHASIQEAFARIDKEAVETLSEEDGGSVVLCVIIIDHKAYVVNLGDSRAILIKKDHRFFQLTDEHTPDKPKESSRIEKMGGYVINVGDKARVQGSLAVSRAVGDKIYKPFVNSMPEIEEFEITSGDKYIVLGSDGLWNECTNEEVGEFLYRRSLNGCSKDLLDMIIDKKGYVEDNTTIICVDLEELSKESMEIE